MIIANKIKYKNIILLKYKKKLNFTKSIRSKYLNKKI